MKYSIDFKRSFIDGSQLLIGTCLVEIMLKITNNLFVLELRLQTSKPKKKKKIGV